MKFEVISFRFSAILRRTQRGDTEYNNNNISRGSENVNNFPVNVVWLFDVVNTFNSIRYYNIKWRTWVLEYKCRVSHTHTELSRILANAHVSILFAFSTTTECQKPTLSLEKNPFDWLRQNFLSPYSYTHTNIPYIIYIILSLYSRKNERFAVDSRCVLYVCVCVCVSYNVMVGWCLSVCICTHRIYHKKDQYVSLCFGVCNKRVLRRLVGGTPCAAGDTSLSTFNFTPTPFDKDILTSCTSCFTANDWLTESLVAVHYIIIYCSTVNLRWNNYIIQRRFPLWILITPWKISTTIILWWAYGRHLLFHGYSTIWGCFGVVSRN